MLIRKVSFFFLGFFDCISLADKFRILSVSVDGFGAALGLQVDDLVVSFDGRDVTRIFDLKLSSGAKDIECQVLRPLKDYSVMQSMRK